MSILTKRITRPLFERFIRIEKTVRFIVSTSLLTSLVLLSTLFFFDKALLFLPLFGVCTYLLTFFALLEGIDNIEWWMLFLVPVLFTVSFYLFFFLFPVRWLTRVPFLLFYAFSIHALLRTANILNVGVEKNLQLYRAAFSVNYFYHTVIIFFLSHFLFSLQLNPFFNGLIAFGGSFLMFLQFLWTIKLDPYLDRQILKYAVVMSALIAQLVAVISFIPFALPITALIVTAVYYSLSGLVYAYLDERLFKETVREYVFVIAFIFFIAGLTLIRM